VALASRRATRLSSPMPEGRDTQPVSLVVKQMTGACLTGRAPVAEGVQRWFSRRSITEQGQNAPRLQPGGAWPSLWQN
jgi:hypothetical protein